MDVWSFLKGGGSDKVEVGAFGKIPAMGDFVRVGAKPLASFETFIEQGMAAGEAKHGERWAGIYSAGRPQAFVFRGPASAKEENVMAGVLAPSGDAVGRRFPLVVFAQLAAKRLEGTAHLVPFTLDSFLIAGTRLVADAGQLAGPDDLRERLSAVPVPSPTAESSKSEYSQWARSTYARSMWGELYGDPDADVALAVLRGVLDAVRPLQNRANPSTSLGLRLPLGRGDCRARAAFWVEAVRRAIGLRSSVSTYFWPAGEHATGASSLLLQLGATPPGSLANLWAPDAEGDDVYDLCWMRTAEYRPQIVAQLPRELAASLARWDAHVADVLAALGP